MAVYRPARSRLGAALLAAVALLAAGCSGQDTPAGHTDSVAGTPYVVNVTCGDSRADAGKLQRAINASPPGSMIQIGGTCALDRGIILRSGRTYAGDSRTGTVLRQAAPMPYVLASAAFTGNDTTTGGPLTIEQLTVACSGQGRTDGIVVLNWQADVQAADVSNCGGSGIVDTSQTANGSSIRNTSVNSQFQNNFITGSGADGFQVIDNGNSVTDGNLVDNRIAGSGGAAIRLANAAGWNISGNHLYNDHGSAIVADRLYATTISGNYIEDFASRQPAGTWYGISGTAQNGNGSTIYGNRVLNDLGETGRARHVYIAITAANAGTGYVAVTGNVIHGAGPGDVAMSFTAGPNRLSIATSGNLITNTGTLIEHSGAVHLSRGT